MKLFGSLKEIVSAVFRKDTYEVTLRPNQSITYSSATDVQLPPKSGTAVLVSSGDIVNADIAAGAAIADSKLATIATAGKVSNSATTATSSNTASAIVARDGSGNFSAGTITASLSGNVTGNVSGTAANVTGTVAIANGGTGQTTQQAALNALAGTQVSGRYLRSDGTNTSLSSIQAADVPTLNQNTTGTAANITATSNNTLTTLSSLSLPGSQVSGNISGNSANVTGTVAIANGGTGQTTQQAAMNALAGTQVANRVLRSDGTNTTLSQVALTTDVSGTLPIGNGGTGQTTANAALNALLPAQGSSANKYLKTDGTNTSWASASGGSGEINAILNPSGADGVTGWVAGTSHNTPVAFSGANNPLDGIVPTAFSFTATAGTASASSGQSGIGIYDDMTLPSGLQNRKLKIEFAYSTPASSAGTWAVVLYQNTTRVALSTDSSGDTVLPSGVTGGKFTAYFDSTNASAYRLLLVQRTRTSPNNLYLTNIIVGPGIQPQGAVANEWAAYTQTVSGGGTAAFTYRTRGWRRVGDSVEIMYNFVVTSAGNGSTLVQIPLPSGMTIDTTKVTIAETALGSFSYYNGTSYVAGGSSRTNSASTTGFFLQKPGGSSFIGSDLVLNSEFFIKATVPIAEWAGNGTVQLAQNDVTYYYGTGGTWGTSATITTAQGPAGAALGTTTPSGTFFQWTIVPSSPIPVGTTPILQISVDQKNWSPVSGNPTGTLVENMRFDGTNQIGASVGVNSSGNLVLTFGKYAYGTTGAWSGTLYYRIAVASPGAAVGFGIVQPGTSSGLVSASGLPGNTTGNAIASGYVGEKLSFTSRSISAVTSGVTGNASALATLTAGVWVIYARIGTSAGVGLTGVLGFIATDGNNTDSGDLTTTAERTFASDPNFGVIAPMVVLYYVASTNTAIYAKAKSYGAATTATIGGYAVRIA